ncbi:RNA-splicing factor [Mortierella sp. GBA43]|nr:RNA-splicing factor [Mortierella sp. GBA43]
MGGGDLNLKKSWHPGTFRNQERVWKEERKAADEEKKLQQLRKELEEERQIQELQRIQEQAGGKKRNDRLDWMYQAAPTGAAKDDKALEDFLLGKRRVDEILNKKDGGMQSLSKNSDAFMNQASKANSAKDIQSKVREDPLLAIKRREQAGLEALMKNPIKIKQLKEGKEVKEKKKKSKKSKDDKADKEERRKERSEHRSKRRHSRDRSDHSSDTDDNRDDRNGHSSRKRRRLSASPDERSVERHSRRINDAHTSSRHRDHDPSHRHSSSARSPSPDQHRSSRDEGVALDLRIVNRLNQNDTIVLDLHGQSDTTVLDLHSRSRSRSPSRSHNIRKNGNMDAEKSSLAEEEDKRRTLLAEEVERRKKAQAEEEAKRRAALAEERERRLAAMTRDAEADAVERKKRLQEIAAMEAKQDAEEESKRSKGSNNNQASFLKEAQKSAYDGMSLADRVQRGRATLLK